MPKRWLIVNADDLGLSRETNVGIFQAHEHGIVTSASLMVRRDGTADAIETSRRFPALSLGLHVDLGEWIYRDGEWQERSHVVPVDNVVAVEAEIRRQIGLFRQLVGRDPTHLDSHQNVHHDTLLCAIFARVARELNVPLRDVDYHVEFCGEFYGRGKTEPYPEGITMENLCRIIRTLPSGITEVCCHPGLDRNLDFDYSAERITEVDVLSAPEVRAEIERQGVILTSYAGLPELLVERTIILSNGMAKSGSTLLTQYTIAILARVFPQNGQKALREAIRAGKLSGIGYFVEHINRRALMVLGEIAEEKGPLVVKIHSNTTPFLMNAVRSGRIKMTFIHRDPRDAILSGIDHCTRSQGRLFPDYTSVADALDDSSQWAQMACNWIASGLPHIVRYSDLVSDPARELARLCAFLHLDLKPQVLEEIIAEERSRRRYGVNQFNRGELLRYPAEMSEHDQLLCRERLGSSLEILGYPA